MRVKDIARLVRAIQSTDIRVIGNYIFGLPGDTLETMQETLEMAIDLNCEFANFNCAMAYPGSQLYNIAVHKGWDLPGEWHSFSQYSYDIVPLPTEHLTPKVILQFRDDAFHRYFDNPEYLDMLEHKFGRHAKEAVSKITRTRLKRRLLED